MEKKDNIVIIKVIYDNEDIKKSNIWNIGINVNNHLLFIETRHNYSDCDLDIFNKMIQNSYFKGLQEADGEIGLIDFTSNNTEETQTVNIFTNSKALIIDKIRTFIQMYIIKETPTIILFENSFEEVLFKNYLGSYKNCFDFLENKVEFVLSAWSSNSQYEQAYKDFYETSIKDIQSDEELIKYKMVDENLEIFIKLQSVIQTLCIKEFYKYLLNQNL